MHTTANLHTLREPGPPDCPSTDGGHELAAETDALAELLLDIYEFSQKNEHGGQPLGYPG